MGVGGPCVANRSNPIRFFRDIGNGYFAGIPVRAVIMIVVYLVIWSCWSAPRFGKQVYAVGGKAEAARLAGINVRRVSTAVHVTAGACAALAGIIFAAP
jgi:ribose transport system permease protein